MKRWTNVMLALCVAAAATACTGDRAANKAEEKAVGTSGTAAEPKADMADRDFVGDMMADGRAEVELGKLAQQKASSKQVKDFAAMMVRDHIKTGAELKTVASNANIDMSKVDADMDHGRDTRDRLATLSGMEFDREYIKAMVDGHEKAVKDIENKANHADNGHVKQWAAKMLPTVTKHLEQARDIHDSLEKRSGS
jgi:putative membrane protein